MTDDNTLTTQDQLRVMAYTNDASRGDILRKFRIQKERQVRLATRQDELQVQMDTLTKIVQGLMAELSAFGGDEVEVPDAPTGAPDG